MKLYLIKLFFYWKEKDRCIESTNLSVLAFVHVIFSMVPIVTKSWRLRWESALPNSDETNNHNKSQLKSTQTICEGWYITGGNFERSKSSLVLVTCACPSIKSASRFCEDKPWSRGKPPQKWIFQNVDYGYVQKRNRTSFQSVENSCVWAFRSHGTMPNVRKFEHQNRGRIYSRCSQQFYRHGVNTLNIEIFVQRRRGCMDTW